MQRWQILIVGLLVVAIVGGAGYLGAQSNRAAVATAIPAPPVVAVTKCDVEQTVTAPGKLVNTHTQKIEMPAAGQLAAVLVQAGDTVQTGQVLARLANAETFSATVAAAQLELLQAQQALSDLHAEAPLKAAEAQQTIVEAQTKLAEAQRQLRSVQTPNLAYYQDQLAEAEAALLRAQQNQEKTDLGALTQAVDAAKANLTEKTNQLNDALTLQAATCPLCDTVLLRGFWVKISEAQAEVVDATNALRLAELNLVQAKTGDADALADATESLQDAQNDLSAVQAPNALQVAKLQAAVAVAEAQLLQAQNAAESLVEGIDPLALALAEAEVAKAQADLATAQETLANVEIHAPFAGVVLEVPAQVGQSLAAGASLFTLSDPTALEVEATVIEEDYPYVAAGQGVSLYLDALPEAVLSGVVARVVPLRAEGDRPLYLIYLALDAVPAKAAAGMSVDAAVVIAQRKEAVCLPRAVAHVAADGTAIVEVWDGVQIQKRKIEVGLRGDSMVEILAGLTVGEQVVTK